VLVRRGKASSEGSGAVGCQLDRSYRRALSHEAARAELRRCAGTQFDPAVVDALVAVLSL
jgi:HD-GYP domain-containing protein (c-di-GMP phosphodiesterase class II)